MSTCCIATIVEGHGDVTAVPILIRRLAERINPQISLRIPRPIRRSRDRIVQPFELEKDIELAAEQIIGPGAILLLIDSDGDCPAQLGPELRRRARAARPDRVTEVVLAHREYEAWFLAAAHSLRGRRGLSPDLDPPSEPENIQGAKEWLKSRMTRSRTYSETVDQPALTALFDIDHARTAPSFDRFCRVLEALLTQSAPE